MSDSDSTYEHTDASIVREKLHNQLGNAVGEHKKRMLNQLRAGITLRDATAEFVRDVSVALDGIAAEWEPKT